jgi:hypothetical protein
MTSAALAQAPVYDSPSYQDALLDVTDRARNGDTEALAYVFDHVFYDVYHRVFQVTRDRRAAERATRKALDRLPAMLRSRRYQTVPDLRDALVQQAQRGLRQPRKAGASVGGMEGLRAATRRFVLISAASIAAAGALILAI